MSYFETAISAIKQHEGFRANAYLCPAKKWTIGWGNTRYLDGRKVKPGEKVTEAQAQELLRKTLQSFDAAITGLVKVPLTDNQRAALLSFIFNVGPPQFATSTLLKLINQKQYIAAADQFPRWIYSTVDGVKTMPPGLATRRADEKKLFLKQ